jgi:tetratricopeptide (TPR) repeat protein
VLDDKVKRMESMAALRRLRKERERLEGASDWMVLSLPAGAPPEMVAQAGERMRFRYQKEASNSALPEEARRLSAELVELIEEALERIRAGRPRETVDPLAGKSDVDIIFDQGVEAAKAGQWDRAIKALRAASKLQLDAPLTMAWLGWAIYKKGGPGAREEALELLQLADSFDDSLDDAQYFLAVLEADGGDTSAALSRLKRVLSHAEHRDARALLNKLKAADRPEPSGSRSR